MRSCGFALGGQTKRVAPADKKLYELRDATATVPYIPLIVASIMSKKLAEGLDALVLDVKTGSGAFIPEYKQTRKLAQALVKTGKAFNVNTHALITDMNQPLGKYVGNALEVYECIKILRGETEDAMRQTLDLSVELTASMLVQCGIDKVLPLARKRVHGVLVSGEALDRFRKNIELQGGDPRVCEKPDLLLMKRLVKVPVVTSESGYISTVDAFKIGRAVCDIGGGRVKAEDGIDHAVGFAAAAKIGDFVQKGDPLGIIYSRSKKQANAVSEKLKLAFRISGEKPKTTKLIRSRV
jgi:pyrimidine-nucleoside phosphorylase